MNDKTYVILKRGFYFRPNAMGYTDVLSEAGHFSKEYAKSYENFEYSYMPLSEAPKVAPYYIQRIHILEEKIEELKNEIKKYEEMITDKQVEASSKAIHHTRMKRAGCNNLSFASLEAMWEQMPHMWKDLYSEDAKAALAAYESAAWQPIETAPRDGTVIIADFVYFTEDAQNPLKHIVTAAKWVNVGAGFWEAFNIHELYIEDQFYGWRPLPQPPGGER